jgi:hypothetical protein
MMCLVAKTTGSMLIRLLVCRFSFTQTFDTDHVSRMYQLNATSAITAVHTSTNYKFVPRTSQ